MLETIAPILGVIFGVIVAALTKRKLAQPTPKLTPEPTPQAAPDPRKPFFAAVRSRFGKLKQSQVDGFNTVLDALEGWPVAWKAYALATCWHETAFTMQPVEEAYWLSDEWRRKNLRYYPWHGRGYVQLTWERNYRKADAELGMNGHLLADPDLAMQPHIAAHIMVRGMEQGWFTERKNADYLPTAGLGTEANFRAARRIINGTDKAQAIARHALAFQEALTA